MSVKTFKKFIEELREQGISIEKLITSKRKYEII
ncbi:Uncharacterised protein [Clostridium perfringens]|nr:Uncharacterised protein [Clostridium perfringens]